MTKPLVYLACPYTHPNPHIRATRFHAANQACGYLLSKGLNVFSPISMCHCVAEDCGLPSHFEFWEKFDTAFISCCAELYVLTLHGWKESKGVTGEIDLARRFEIPIFLLNQEDTVIHGNIVYKYRLQNYACIQKQM